MQPSTPDIESLPPRPQQLIVSIFGLYARTGADHRGALPVSGLIRLLAEVGVESAAVRSSVSRLKKRGVLNSAKVDDQAGYALASDLQDVFTEGDERIFGARRAEAGDPWLLVSFTVPESQRNLRHRIRRLLSGRGFGSVAAGLWIAPAWLHESTAKELAHQELDAYVDFFEAQPAGATDIAERMATWWDLPALSAQYQNFLTDWAPVQQRWQQATGVDQRQAFSDHLQLVTEWRRLPYLDPGLPLAHLPEPWPGQEAAELFTDLHRRLAPPAGEHALTALGHSGDRQS